MLEENKNNLNEKNSSDKLEVVLEPLPNKLSRIGLGKIISMGLLICIFLVMWFFYYELYVAEAQNAVEVNFVVERGESVASLAERLKKENIIRNIWIFKKYLRLKNIDTKIQAGEFGVIYPITLSRVALSLKNAIPKEEIIITIIPGWDLRDLADYFKKKSIISREKELYDLLGKSAVYYKDGEAPKFQFNTKLLSYKPDNVSYEGYLAPDTYRIFEDASLEEVLEKFFEQQNKLFTEKMYTDIKNSRRTVHEILTMASILEREVQTLVDKAKVADIFWRRLDKNWALQADSTVHYITGEKGDVFTTKQARSSVNLWNTYEYAGLPPGPIALPSLDSIMAAIYPEGNDYWYFLTTFEGEVKYGRDLDEHNNNVRKYLR